ncbi:MAG: hypothetical protein QGG48_10875 [Desulfatiglandales bacterium]|nr:hypothetical protein [Desulfatiglandales bacterium]
MEHRIGDVHHSSQHRRATEAEMGHYFGQIAPGVDSKTARERFWNSVDVFGKEGSRKKEAGIKKRILGPAGKAKK